ncbi:YheC/D like ATP-grasp [Bacillus sp. OV322]|uniref:YheC/YheD family protein n=1 Tax=Bacillus sp. OV322 TaxID=1882764 RepID=UPI0008E7D23D|nr:YheC/YheD family protein [Bacillus sp. OV322]SFC77939.1 YheC/D like ATP-grasp [Bacillus sp. OV322]
MKDRLGKWKQYTLLGQHPLLSKHLPETKLYSIENLSELLERYEYVYLKNNRGGRGKGIYKVFKSNDGLHCFNGYPLNGEKIKKCVVNIEDFHPILHPIERFGGYIVQEGIKSLTPDGHPLSIRVHVQTLNGKWLIGGMYGMIAIGKTMESGVINMDRGAQAMRLDKLLSVHLKLDKTEKNKVINSIKTISILAAEMVASEVPRIEYGIDLGISQSGKPIIFEINTSPAVGLFSKMGNGEMGKRIKAIRKMHKENQIDM